MKNTESLTKEAPMQNNRAVPQPPPRPLTTPTLNQPSPPLTPNS